MSARPTTDRVARELPLPETVTDEHDLAGFVLVRAEAAAKHDADAKHRKHGCRHPRSLHALRLIEPANVHLTIVERARRRRAHRQRCRRRRSPRTTSRLRIVVPGRASCRRSSTRSGSVKGSGRSSSVFTGVNTVTFAAMPSAGTGSRRARTPAIAGAIERRSECRGEGCRTSEP